MVTMTGMEPLQRLFHRTGDMVQDVDNAFEQHFLWLEEVVAEARQTLASADLVLLPKTPSAAPGRTRRVLNEDAENLPPTARRGRLCSKLALEKIQEQGRISRLKKLRRPSSPDTQAVPPSTHKSVRLEVPPSPVRSIEEPDESPAPVCERVVPSSPRSSRGSGQQSTKLNLKPRKLHTPEKDTSSPKKGSSSLQEDPVSTQKGDGSPQNDNIISPESRVTLEQKEDTHSQKDGIHEDHSSLQANSTSSPVEVISPHRKSYSKEVVNEPSDTLPKVIQEGDSSDTSQNTTKATVISQGLPQEEEICLQLDDSFDECASVDHPEEEQDIEVVLEVPKRQQTKKETTQNKPISPKISNTKEIKEDSVSLNNLPQLPSVLDPVVTCSKQEANKDEPSSDTLLPSCSAPPARVTRTKQRAMETSRDASPSSDSLPRSPSVPAPRVTRTKQKVTKVQDVPSPSDSLPQSPVVPAPRVTRTKQRAIEAQDAVLTSPSSPPSPSPFAPAPRVTRTKQKAIEKEIPPSSPSLPQPAPRMTRTKQKAKDMDSLQQTTSIKLDTKDNQEDTKPRVTQAKRMDQHHPHEEEDDTNTKASRVKDSGVFSLGVRKDGWGSTESLSSEESSAPSTQPSTPPVRITRSKMSKLQRPQHSPEKALPATDRFPRVYCSPRGTALTKSPCNKSPATRKLALHLDRDGGKDHLASQASHSPIRVVRHTPDKAGKMVLPRQPVFSSGRVTPNLISRMQPFFTASNSSSSSSASTEHRRIIKKTVGTPNEGRRPVNIVSGITSFIKSQPTRPGREEMEEYRLQELQRKKEYEVEMVKKKEQLLWAKAEERKRCNEERMRRAKEARLKREQMAAAAKDQQKRDRQQREARQREEDEQQRRLRQQQLAKKKAEEEAKKATKLKEEEEKKKQEEEEKKRKKQDEERRRQKLEEVAMKKLEEERRIYLEEQRKLKMVRAQMMKEKEESLLKLREKELQPKKEAVIASTYTHKEIHQTTPASTINASEKISGHLNTTYTTTSGGHLNSTYTKAGSGGASVASVKADSYEMTPVQPKRISNALNDYCIDNIQSDDSTDDENSPKKKIPQWAMKTRMRAAVMQQEHFPPKMDNIFPPSSLLIPPDLSKMFPKQKRRFKKRTSSAIWETPPSKFFCVNSPM